MYPFQTGGTVLERTEAGRSCLTRPFYRIWSESLWLPSAYPYLHGSLMSERKRLTSYHECNAYIEPRTEHTLGTRVDASELRRHSPLHHRRPLTAALDECLLADKTRNRHWIPPSYLAEQTLDVFRHCVLIAIHSSRSVRPSRPVRPARSRRAVPYEPLQARLRSPPLKRAHVVAAQFAQLFCLIQVHA